MGKKKKSTPQNDILKKGKIMGFDNLNKLTDEFLDTAIKNELERRNLTSSNDTNNNEVSKKRTDNVRHLFKKIN